MFVCTHILGVVCMQYTELQRFNTTRVDDRLYQTTPLSKLYPNVTGPGQQEVLVR
jgi:hypothetical protein